MNAAPEGLHELNYARHILEELLGWPSKGNLELIADCIRSISISRKLTLVQAHTYLQRVIRLAKQQQIPVNKFFFQDGVYTEIRPEMPETVTATVCRNCDGKKWARQYS